MIVFAIRAKIQRIGIAKTASHLTAPQDKNALKTYTAKRNLMRLPNISTEQANEVIKLMDAAVRNFAKFVLVLIFACSMLAILYSLIWNTQPMKDVAPADKAFFEILKMMVSFLAGALSATVGQSSPMPPMPMMPAPCNPMGGAPMGYAMNPAFSTAPMPSFAPQASTQTNWTPPPPPSNPPHHLEDEEERLAMAHARESTRG